MFTHMRSASRTGLARVVGPVALAAAGILAAGCSADITRFDSPYFALTESGTPNSGAGGPSARRSGSALNYDDGSGSLSGNAAPAPLPRGGSEATVAPLPPIERQPQPAHAQPQRNAALPAAPAQPRPTARGEQIEVQPGDTLYGISRRHNVMISELMAANDLKGPNLKPGQRLYLPPGASQSAAPRAPLSRPTAAEKAASGPPVPLAPAPTGWSGTHTIRSGESLYQIARQHNVKAEDLQAVNGIADVRRVRPGTVIRVPGRSGSPSEAGSLAAAPAAAAAPAQQATQPEAIVAPVSATTPGVLSLSARDKGQQVASAEARQPVTDAAGAGGATGAAAKLRWPVRGRIVEGFGPRADGTSNDGIDLAVPQGTDVVAAEAGSVVHAGEFKGYGNLVLLRHENGWVTAYAHNERLLVQRGDQVRRGQPIAKAGKSGTVGQPQVHFELRFGAKPVDPTPYMERM